MPEHNCCPEPVVNPNCTVRDQPVGERLQNIADCALTKAVEDKFFAAVVALYEMLVQFVEEKLCIDLSQLYAVLACLAIVCWLNRWLKFLRCVACELPQFIQDICHLKYPSCLLTDCDEEDEHEDDE